MVVINRYLKVLAQTGAYNNETFAVTTGHVIDSDGEDISADKGRVYHQPSTRRTHREGLLGQQNFSGPLNIPFYTIGVPTLLYYLLGSATTVVDTPQLGSNTHSIRKAASIPPFNMAAGRDVKEHQYVGCLLNGLTIDIVPDDTVNISLESIIRKELATATIASETIPDYDDAERAFSGAETDAKMGPAESATSSVTFIENASITLENNIQSDARSVGSAFLPQNIIAELVSTGSFDLRFDDASNYDDFIADTKKRLQFIAIHDAGVGAERSIDIDCPNIEYDSNTLPTENVQRYIEALEFHIDADVNDDPLIIKVVNQETNAQITA